MTKAKAAPEMKSMGSKLSVAVFGASGGIGQCFVTAFAEDEAVRAVHAFSRSPEKSVSPAVSSHPFDLLDEGSIEHAAELVSRSGPLHLVIVATGLLQDGDTTPEKRAHDLSPSAMERLFQINAIGPALIAKHFLPLLERERKSVFAALSARVGSIEDNQLGGWHSYRASKAALNMFVKNHAIELAYRNTNAVCVALHPGTVATSLSEPFQRNVPAEKLFTPDHAVAQMLTVIDSLTPADSGGLFAWDGQRIPY